MPLDHLHLRDVAIFLDVDGTLLDIAAGPDAVRIPLSLNRTLERLAHRTAGAAAFVSGRSLADLDRLFAPRRLPGIGVHGAEMRISGAHPALARATPLDSGLKQKLADLARTHPGIITEDKIYTFALHYRAAPEHERALRAGVAALCRTGTTPETEIMQGKAVIEVKSGGFSKGAALREMMTCPPFAGRRPLFIGDDITDESVFAVLPSLGGWGISVGRAIAGAAHVFKCPRDVRQWLDGISRENEKAAP